MHSKLFSFLSSLVIVFIIIVPKESAIAEPEAVNDTYELFEDIPFKVSTGPLAELNFDEESIAGFIEDDWAILDRIENQNGDAEDYPTDGSGREWLDPEFDIDSSNVGPWFLAPSPIQSGEIDAFPGLDDELFGIDEAANGENLITTYLFRNSFTVNATEAEISSWELSYLVDDGAVVYINGIEVHRSAAIPEGELTTLTSAVAGANNENVYETAAVDLSGILAEGNNSIAVELHQAGVESSDVGFDLNIAPRADGGAISYSFIDDPFDAPFETSAPNNASGNLEQGSGFEDSTAANIRVGGGARFQTTISSGSLRLPITLANPATLEISFRYRLLMIGGYESEEYSSVILAVGDNFVGTGTNDDIFRMYGPDGDGDEDSGWRTFSAEVSLPSGTHNLDFGVYNNASTTSGEVTDVWFDDILIEYEGGGSGGGVLENDTVEAGQVTAAIFSNPFHGTVEMNADGSFTYVPEEDFFGVDSFTYTVTDDTGTSSEATVTLNVASVNDLPKVTDRSFSMNEDDQLVVNVELGLSMDSSDAENQDLDFAVESAPSNGTVEINLDGSFEYVPNPNFEGTDSFTYVALDGEDSSVPSEVKVEIIPVNDPPEVVDDTYSVIENNSLVVSQSGISLPESVLSENFDAEVNFAFTGNVEIEPVGEFASINGFEGSFLRNLTSGNPADATTITINDLPPHDRLSIGFVLAIIDSWDGDLAGGDSFSVTVDGEPVFSHTFNNSGPNGQQSYVPSQEIELARSVDLGFSSGPQSLDSAYDLRKEPSLSNIPHSDDSVTIEIYASGANWEGGDDESWAIDNFEVRSYQSAQFNLISQGSVWLYLDDGSDQGLDWIDEDYDDSDWESGTGKFGYGDDNESTLISFGDDDNDKYVTTYFRHSFEVEDTQRFEELLIGLLRDDGAAVYINGTEVARSNLENGAGFQDFAPDFAGGDDENNYFEFPVDPSVLVPGENLIAVEVHQNSGSSSDLGFDLRLVGTLSRASAILGNDIDVDTDSLQVSLLSPPDNGKLQLQSDGSFTYVPNVNFEGSDSFEYRVTDGEFEDSGKVFITVDPGPNDLPIVEGEEYEANEDTPLIIDVGSGVLENDYDPDGVEITAVIASSPENGTVELSDDGSFTYSPDENYYGKDQFTYHVADAFGKAPPAVVVINVIQVNDAPIANDDHYLTAPGTELGVNVQGLLTNDIDPDGDTLQSEILTEPESGTINFQGNGNFTYVPIPEFSGQVSFTYRVTDGEISSDPAIVTIDINASPVAKVNRYVVYEDGVLSRTEEFGVIARSSDPEGDPLSANVVQAPIHGSLSLMSDGSFTYTPDLDFSGLDFFTYSVSDGYQESSPVQTQIYVIQVDDAPIAKDDEYFVLIGQSVNVSADNGVLVNDKDAEGNPAQAVLVDYSGEGNLVLNEDGSFEYTPIETFAGKEYFTYQSLANGKKSNVATVELKVGGPDNTVLITEIMYHPVSGNPAEEYIEIHNIGSGPVPLQGWQITSGIGYEFPAINILPGEYLVVAADPQIFSDTWDQEVNVIGPWSGQLSDRGERIRIKDALGEEVDDVTYSDQGDWASRRAEDDDRILNGESGWKWTSRADGGGASLELVNLDVSNKHGQNWEPSQSPTPGKQNSVFSTDAAPLILNVKHAPAIPRSGDTVTISADIKDNGNENITTILNWRVSALDPDEFIQARMRDDGKNGDEESGDGTFTAQVPAQDDGTIVEFYIRANDDQSERGWPEASGEEGQQQANALFQFDDERYDGNQPIYRLVMSVREDQDFRFRNFNSGSDAQKNATLIAKQGQDYDIRYQCGVRVRGAGSRTRNPRNNRLNIPRDNPWNGVTKINLNSQFIYLQFLGSRLASLSGIEAADAKPVQFRYNGVNRATDNDNNRRYGSYLHIEAIDGDWADIHYPLDSAGNLYSKGRPDVKWDIRSTNNGLADRGAYIRDGWSKGSNESIDDWEDLHQFMITMNGASGSGYLEQISGMVDVKQWSRWFAFMTIILSRETNLSNGTDDDYKLYRGVKDPRIKLVPHDFDTIFGLGDTDTDADDSIFPAITNFAGQTIPQLNRFFSDPVILRQYYSDLKDLLNTVFEKSRFDALVSNSLDWLPSDSDVSDDVIGFMDERRAYILNQIPSEFTVSSNLPSSDGFSRTEEAGITGLEGAFDSSQIAEIKVNGMSVPLNVRNGTWDGDQAESEVIFSAGSEWSYLDDGSDQGVLWREQDFDDSLWALGQGEFGYGDRGEDTVVSYGGDDENKHITTYFRKDFEVTNADAFSSLNLRLVYDDGAAVYLNGIEIVRQNLEPDALYTSLATDTVPNAGFESYNVPVGALKSGSNTIAVEIHQRSPSSRDISFNAELLGLGAVPLMVPGINLVKIESFDADGSIIDSSQVNIWYDDGGVTEVASIDKDTIWTLEGGPYLINEDLEVPVDVTLQIDPGVTVYFAEGRRMTVKGRLVAEGNDKMPIVFTNDPGSDGGWDGIYFESTKEESRMIYILQDGADSGDQSISILESRVHLENVEWGGTDKTILELSNPQIDVLRCDFPSTLGQEVIHGEGLGNDGYFNLKENIFRTSSGYNDIIDFSGGRRPGPIIYVVDNVFLGSADDCLDLDGVDAHIEGNHFFNVHKDDPDRQSSANAIAADNDSHLTVVRNLFYDVDHAILLKNASDAVFENNTVVDAVVAAISFDEPLVGEGVPGDFISIKGNIFYNNGTLFAYQFSSEDGEEDPLIEADMNLLPEEFLELGIGNISGDPMFIDQSASDFSISRGSPVTGKGINGSDMGYNVFAGAIVAGEPPSLTRKTEATLRIHVPGISGIEGESNFSGEYRWRIDGNEWSDPTSVSEPIQLSDLSDGTHYVEVVGRDSAGNWQAEPTRSRSWNVDKKLSRLLISEVLADNGDAFNHEETFPDYIELWNDSGTPRFVSGMVISESKDISDGWKIPTGTVISPGEFLLIYANDADGTSGLHTGFALDRDGDSLYLFESTENGGELVDNVRFGSQLRGRSISRTGPDQQFALTLPTPGAKNDGPLPVREQKDLVINEWLASNGVVFDNDFIEIYNPSNFPVSIGGMTITDDPNNIPDLYRVSDLSFIDSQGYVKFIADSDSNQGPSHLNFGLSKLNDQIGLFDDQGNEIDRIGFVNAEDDVSIGRSVEGERLLSSFSLPTPGYSNDTDLTEEILIIEGLRVTEIMYNPLSGPEGEYIKLQNIGEVTLRLNDVRFEEGVRFAFPDALLEPGQSAYVVSNIETFTSERGENLNVLGEYEGKLDNGGERLRLEIDSISAGILDFEYEDEWYPETDGTGSSLVMIDDSVSPLEWGLKENWNASVVAPSGSYSEWVKSSFGQEFTGQTGKDDDPDKDGIANLLEFVFVLDPTKADPDFSMPKLSRESGDLLLTYTVTKFLDDIKIKVQVSYDLIEWNDAGESVSVDMIAEDETIRTYEAKLDGAITDGSLKRFMRLHVE